MKHEKIIISFLFVLTFITIFSTIMTRSLNNLDEIWEYSFAKNIADGLIPYRDFNMIVTPLFAIICGIILKITFNELIIMRILFAIVLFLIYIVVYNIFLKLNLSRIESILFTFVTTVMLYNCTYLDYNLTTLLLVLVMIYIELSNLKIRRKATSFFLGVLAGLAITLKQSSGIFICIATIACSILSSDEKKFKIIFKNIFENILGTIIPVAVMLVYLYLNGAISDFVNYAILGLTEFSNHISYTHLIRLDSIGILAILVPILTIFIVIKRITIKKDKTYAILFLYSLAMFSIIYPIADEIHFLVGSVPMIVLILFEVSQHITKSIKLDYVIYGMILFLTIYSIGGICCIIAYYSSSKETRIDHYKYIYIADSDREDLTQVKDYVLSSDKKVLILDSCAARFFIPLDIYNKDYDLLQNGNLGKNGEEKIINEIASAQNTVYLILKDEYEKNWQLSVNIIEYVKENKNKVGEIAIFDIYE